MTARAKAPLAAAVFFASLMAPASLPASDSVREVVDEANASFIFVFRPEVPSDRVPAIAGEIVRQHGAALRHVFARAIKGFSATVPEHVAARIAAQNPDIHYYERNGVVWAIGQLSAAQTKRASNEPLQIIPPGITRVGGPVDGSGRRAWVIDTGIDLMHPDLNVGPGANFVLRGKNSPNDGNGHGTHVAGIIGAIDNRIGVVGVAANTKVHPVRVLNNSGVGTIDGVIAGVDYVAGHAAAGDCANMSLGATGHFQSLHDAVYNTASLGIRFSVAAGNESAPASGAEPAHVEHPNVYTVSAVDATDVFAGFSNYGNPPVDFAAPGVNIVSTQRGGGVVAMSGTSMAAPHVCGLLLFNTPISNGYAVDDPDGTADPIAHF